MRDRKGWLSPSRVEYRRKRNGYMGIYWSPFFLAVAAQRPRVGGTLDSAFSSPPQRSAVQRRTRIMSTEPTSNPSGCATHLCMWQKRGSQVDKAEREEAWWRGDEYVAPADANPRGSVTNCCRYRCTYAARSVKFLEKMGWNLRYRTAYGECTAIDQRQFRAASRWCAISRHRPPSGFGLSAQSMPKPHAHAPCPYSATQRANPDLDLASN